jgi:signal transduction histidine kinase
VGSCPLPGSSIRINDILDFSKIEAGKLEMENVEFNLNETLNSVANLSNVKAREKKDIEVLFLIDRDAPQYLMGDQAAQRQHHPLPAVVD